MDLRIRAAEGPEDMEAVRGLLGEYMGFLLGHPGAAAHFSVAAFEREIAGLPAQYVQPGGVLVASRMGRPVGCLALQRIPVTGPLLDADPGAGVGIALEIKRLWVQPQARGLGLGRRLLEAALVHARREGASAVYLDTLPEAMPEACRIYEALGFERVPRYNGNRWPGVEYFRLRLAPVPEPAEVTEGENPTI